MSPRGTGPAKPATGKKPPSRRASRTARIAGKAPATPAPGPATPVVEAPAELPFERFTIDYLLARGGRVRRVAALEHDAEFDTSLARILRRAGARLVFDPERVILPRGGVFVAPGSRFGLLLVELARGKGQVTRGYLEPVPDADAETLARDGFPLHGATLTGTKLGERRWVVQFVFQFTMTMRGGIAEQDARAVFADPRGPQFEFLESDELRARRVQPGFPNAPVWWDTEDVVARTPGEPAGALWTALLSWLNRVQEARFGRWRRRCEEARDRDLARVNDFYQTRLDEERDRRLRRRDPDEEDRATEAELKLEWGRRVRAVRARWEPSVELRLWGIEEVARPRVPVAWTFRTPAGTRTIEGEVDLADGRLARLPCPICGRLVGEFWWEGTQPVCRRCRGRGKRLAVVERTVAAEPALAGARRSTSETPAPPSGRQETRRPAKPRPLPRGRAGR